MSGTFTPTPGHQHFLAGFDNSADCSLSFGGTRTVTITPVGSTFRVWANGQKFDKPTTTKQISTDQGLHFVYFDTSGVIQESHTTPWSITGLGAPICTVYWDGTNGALCDERHSAYRDRYWHKWAHDTVGTRWMSGFVPTINANCTFSISTGVAADEDLQFNTGGAKTACTQWHRNATGWLLESNKSVLYHGTSGAPEYDASGTMTAIDNNKYFNSYIYATGDVLYPIYCVIGQAQHNTLAGATGEAIPSFTSAQFVAEMKLLYRVTMQFSGGAATYVQYQDYRTSSTLPAGQATASQAAQVSFAPAGGVASTNVQAAIEELDAEKSATSHTHDGLLSAAQATDLTDGGETTLHSHAAGAVGHQDSLTFNTQASPPSTPAASHVVLYAERIAVPGTGSWSAGGNLGTGRKYFAGAGDKDSGLSFGGHVSGYTNVTEEYDGTSWSAGGNLGTSRGYLGGAGTQNAGLSIGGSTGSNSAVTEEYNGTSWSAGGNLGTAKYAMASAGTQNAGLCMGSDATSAVTEEYDGSAWSAGGNLGTGANAPGGCGTQIAGLKMGGLNSVAIKVTEEYNGTSWSAGGNLGTARYYTAAAGLQDSGLVFGGAGPLSSTEEYNGTSWSAGGNLGTARVNHCGGGSSQTTGFAAGGNSNSTSTEEYTISSNTYYSKLYTISEDGTKRELKYA